MLFKSTNCFVIVCLHSRLLVQQVLTIDLRKQTSEKSALTSVSKCVFKTITLHMFHTEWRRKVPLGYDSAFKILQDHHIYSLKLSLDAFYAYLPHHIEYQTFPYRCRN